MKGVGANDASRGVHAVEIGRTVDTVEEAETVLELAISDSEVINIGAKFDSDEAAATVIDGASGFDDRARSSHCILHDLPEASVGESDVGLKHGNASGFAVVAATEETPAFQGSVVGNEEREAFDLERERIVELDNGDYIGGTVPSLLGSGLNVALF